MICGVSTPRHVNSYKKVSAGALIVLAVVFALRRINDFDTFWHLAAGRWFAGGPAILVWAAPMRSWLSR
jgi:hypothetical protein